MDIVAPPHRSAAPSADDFFSRPRTERRVLAVQIDGYVERVGLWAVGHRAPALEAGRARTHIHLHANLRNHLRVVGDLARVVDAQNVLIPDIRRLDELPGHPVDLPQDAELAHRQRRFASVHIDQDALERFIHILRFAGNMLVVPLHLAGIGIERERGARVQRRPIGAANRASPRLRLGGTPVDQVGLRIVAARHPHIASGAELERQIAPGVTTRLTGPGDARRAPELFSCGRVQSGDEADIVLVSAAAGNAGNHLAAHDDRASGVLIAQ